MDYATLFDSLVKTYGPVGAIFAGLAYFLWRDRGSRKLADADSDASVDAIGEWRGIAQELRAANKELAARADSFAADRNERIQENGRLQAQIAELSGLVKTLTDQLGAARGEIARLTQEIEQLRGQR